MTTYPLFANTQPLKNGKVGNELEFLDCHGPCETSQRWFPWSSLQGRQLEVIQSFFSKLIARSVSDNPGYAKGCAEVSAIRGVEHAQRYWIALGFRLPCSDRLGD